MRRTLFSIRIQLCAIQSNCKSVLRLLSFAITVAMLQSGPMYAHGLLPQTQWFRVTKPQGYVLLVHGLNQDPDKLKPIARIYNQLRWSALLVRLPGHREEAQQELTQIETDQIKSAISSAYQKLKNKAGPLPIAGFGFSMGGLLISWAQTQRTFGFDHVVLVAPALRIRWYTYTVQALFPFFSVIPSKSPPAYRANNQGTSVALYKSFFEIYNAFQSQPKDRLNIPSLIVFHPQDELIATQKLKAFKARYGLDRWRFLTVKNNRALINDFNHLVIDQNTMTPVSWLRLQTHVKALVDNR